jgi:hypothetical protein
MQECKYCGEQKVLVKSHIIPKSFYEIKSFKKKTPKKSLSLVSDSKDFNPKRKPIGLYDKELFCEGCESKFMIYDDYASKLLIEQRDDIKTFTDEKGEFAVKYYEAYDYQKLKFFFISVLLRAGLTQNFFFQHVNLGPYVEISKDLINDGRLPNSNVFATFLEYYKEIKSGPLFFPPDPIRIESVKFYRFHIGRLIFNIKVDKRNVPDVLYPIILKPNRKLILLQKSLQDSNAYDILRGAVKNPSNEKYFSV